MATVEATKEQAKSGVKGTTGLVTTIQIELAKIEILVGGPYKNHSYGHVALRVVTKGADKVYDYGRYGDTWGLFRSEGEGILNIWTSFNSYIANENSYGRTTTGFRYDISEEKAIAINQFFEAKIASKKPRLDTGTMKSYRIDDYYALGPNCTTLTLKGAKIAIPDIDRDATKFNQGGGLGIMEKSAASAQGWPNDIFMPADLQSMLAGNVDRKPTKVSTYKK